MSEKKDDDKIILPHHEQQGLCTTRLPYRQGRKLTAVKVYTINNESNHLLIFGVPSLNLRQEAKVLFLKFGKLKAFNLAKDYKSEQFTDTYHAVFEKIQLARIAKRMLDTKNFYGGSLHVTYAPELEDLEETKTKLLQRKYDVISRLRNLQTEKELGSIKNDKTEPVVEKVVPKLNMGEANIICYDVSASSARKRKHKDVEQFKPCFIQDEIGPADINVSKNTTKVDIFPKLDKLPKLNKIVDNIEIVDCTSTEVETITNVDEYILKADGIKVYKVPEKPLNKIKFIVNKKS